MIKFEFSEAPPSANKQTTVGSVIIKGKKTPRKKTPRKMKSKDYVAWCLKADLELIGQRGSLKELCYYSAYVLIPGHVGTDLDNNLKAILDAVRRAARIPDDRYCVDIRIRFHAGPMVVAAFTEEEVSKWARIKRASRLLIRRMAKFSQSTLPL